MPANLKNKCADARRAPPLAPPTHCSAPADKLRLLIYKMFRHDM